MSDNASNTQKEPEVPMGFCKLVRTKMVEQGISLRQVAKRAGISPSFLHRILKRERGLPDNEVLYDIADALDIEPRERLLIAAGRVSGEWKESLEKEATQKLMRAIGPLSNEDMQEVVKTAEAIRRKHYDRKKGR